MKTLLGFGVVIIAVYASTFLPFYYDVMPSGLITINPTLSYDTSNTPRDETELARDLEEACDQVPLLVRPFANKPDHVKVSVEGPDRTVKTGDVSCSSGELGNYHEG